MLADLVAGGGFDFARLGRQICARNSANGRSPMKQMPVLSFLSNTGSASSRAMRRTSAFCSEPIGNSVRASACEGIACRK